MIDIYIIKLNSVNKYSYINTQEKLLNLVNKKQLIKLFNAQNSRKIMLLVE